MKHLILDSYALISLFDDEPSAAKVEKLLDAANKQRTQLAITVVNAGEIWYNYAKTVSKEFADEILNATRQLRIDFIDINWRLTQIAATYKASGGISYADCFAAALAKDRNAPLVTGDPEFKQLEKEIEIIWV